MRPTLPLLLGMSLFACAAPAPLPHRRMAPPRLAGPCGYPVPRELPLTQIGVAYAAALRNLAACSGRAG